MSGWHSVRGPQSLYLPVSVLELLLHAAAAPAAWAARGLGLRLLERGRPCAPEQLCCLVRLPRTDRPLAQSERKRRPGWAQTSSHQEVEGCRGGQCVCLAVQRPQLRLALPWRGEGGGRGLALLLPSLVEHVDASLLAPVGVGGACEGD